jgi:hypothetical protein
MMLTFSTTCEVHFAGWSPTGFTADFSLMRSKENDGTDSNVNSGVLDSDTPQSTPRIFKSIPATPMSSQRLPT